MTYQSFRSLRYLISTFIIFMCSRMTSNIVNASIVDLLSNIIKVKTQFILHFRGNSFKFHFKWKSIQIPLPKKFIRISRSKKLIQISLLNVVFMHLDLVNSVDSNTSNIQIIKSKIIIKFQTNLVKNQ